MFFFQLFSPRCLSFLLVGRAFETPKPIILLLLEMARVSSLQTTDWSASLFFFREGRRSKKNMRRLFQSLKKPWNVSFLYTCFLSRFFFEILTDADGLFSCQEIWSKWMPLKTLCYGFQRLAFSKRCLLIGYWAFQAKKQALKVSFGVYDLVFAKKHLTRGAEPLEVSLPSFHQIKEYKQFCFVSYFCS